MGGESGEMGEGRGERWERGERREERGERREWREGRWMKGMISENLSSVQNRCRLQSRKPMPSK